MADPSWLSYTGTITGIIGTVTGVAGAVLGYVGYRQSREMKALDLRLQLGRAENETRSALDGLPATIELGRQSRQNVSAAAGRTGASQAWVNYCAEDLRLIEGLKAKLPPDGIDYATVTPDQLAAEIVRLHQVGLQVSRLVDKYRAAMEEDERLRDQIRIDIRARGGSGSGIPL